jgi:hypothetical protein
MEYIASPHVEPQPFPSCSPPPWWHPTRTTPPEKTRGRKGGVGRIAKELIGARRGRRSATSTYLLGTALRRAPAAPTRPASLASYLATHGTPNTLLTLSSWSPAWRHRRRSPTGNEHREAMTLAHNSTRTHSRKTHTWRRCRTIEARERPRHARPAHGHHVRAPPR